ncbi:MAG: hypothetical protein QM783_06410 [Phycisphaerales bacterium]
MRDLFDFNSHETLPLWAQVLLASRMTRRAALWMPRSVSTRAREALVAGCDALDRCTVAGSVLADAKEALRKATSFDPDGGSYGAATAMYYALDAAHAAESSLDFSAAETACTASVGRAIAAAADGPGLNPLQARIFITSDVDLLAFGCKEAGIGRYDGVGPHVPQRLTPVHPPSERDLDEVSAEPDEDETHGAR